jgi:hypothetical protein
MTDSPELAAIRARDAYFEKEHMEVYSRNSAYDVYAVSDRRTLLAMLDEATLELDNVSQLSRGQADILTATVNILRGPPPELTLWSHHDVAEWAKAFVDAYSWDLTECRAVRDEAHMQVMTLRAALEKIRAYSPGQFRTLEDEIAIWRIATEALGIEIPKAGDAR